MSDAKAKGASEEPRTLLNVLSISVRFSDMDVNGHVNNATYFTYFEQTRIEWLQRVGLQNTAEHEGPVVVQTSCSYQKPIPYPETLEVRLYGGVPRRSSFPTYYEIHGCDGERVKYAEGQAIMVWIDRKSSSSRTIPPALRLLLPHS